MKLLTFNKAALLKALRLCALLLAYAATQVAVRAQFNPTTGTAGNDTVTASGTFTGSFNGNGGTDTITIQLGADVSASGAYTVSITAGSVTNNGTLSATQDGTVYAIYSDNGSFSLTNPGTIQVDATDPSQSIGFGLSAFSNGSSAVMNFNNAGNLTVLAESSSTYSWAYGARVQTDVSGASSLTFNNGETLSVTSSSSDYSWAAGIYVGRANALNGDSTVSFSNSGTMQVTSGDSFNADSKAYGFYTESRSENGNNSITASNLGTITVSSGYGYEQSLAMGVRLHTAAGAGAGNASIQFTNSNSISASSGTSNLNDDSEAYGVEVSSMSDLGTSSIQVTNSASISALSGDANDGDSLAYAVSAYSASIPSATVTINNSGSLIANSDYANGSSLATGLDATSNSTQPALTMITSSGTIQVSSSYAYSGSSTATGINASSNGDLSAIITIANTGAIGSVSGYAKNSNSLAYGIKAFGLANDSAVTTVTNGATLTVTSGDASGFSAAVGITARSEAADSLAEVINTATINATGGFGNTASSAYGIDARAISATSNGRARITNSGTINATATTGNNTYAVGINAQADNVQIFNSGTITATGSDNAIGISATGSTLEINSTGGAVISNQTYAITLDASSAGVLNINGFTNIQGVMAGFGSNDTLNLNLLGLSPIEAAQIQDYLTLNPNTGTFTVDGKTFSYEAFENVVLESRSFSSLMGGVPGLQDFGAALDRFNGTFSPEFSQLLSDAAVSGKPGQTFSKLAGQDILDVLNQLNLNTVNQLGQSLAERAMTLRNGSNGLDFSGLRINDSSMLAQANDINNHLDGLGLLAGSERLSDTPVDSGVRVTAPAKRSGAWIRGQATKGEQEKADGISGYDTKTFGATLGLDYKILPNLALGVMTGYSGDTADIDGGSSVEGDSAIFGLYAVWAKGGWHAEALAAYLRSEYEITRNVLGKGASGNTSGNTGAVNVGGGYDFKAGGWNFGPTAGLQYAHAVVDGYTQKGTGIALKVGDETIDSLQSILGVQASKEFDLGMVRLTPQVLGSWHHEFMNDSNGTSTSFVNAPGLSSFNVEGRDPERDFGLVGANLTAVFQDLDLITFFAGYNAQVGQASYISHTINGGLKISY